MKEDEKGIRDVEWEDVEHKKESSGGEIKFRKKNRKTIFIKISKGIVFILVAAFSGGISATYIADKKYSQFEKENNNKSVIQGNSISKNYAGDTSNSVAEVAQSVSQSVVEVSNSDDNTDSNSSNTGSGIIFKSDGYIVTNYHLIRGSNKYFVRLSNVTTPLKATLIGYDTLTDLAVLKVNRKNLQAVVFGDSTTVQLGDYVVAIGSPFGGDTTTGIISSTNKKLHDTITGASTPYNVLQTEATINQGNNGGALCNMNGEVIGINNLKTTESDNEDGMGVAMSINDAKGIINSIVKNGHVLRPSLGINSEDYITGDNGEPNGVLVKDIISGTQAAKSGIKPKDIIVEFDSMKLVSTGELQDILVTHKVGDSVPIIVSRNGKAIKLNIVLSEQPVNEKP